MPVSWRVLVIPIYCGGVVISIHCGVVMPISPLCGMVWHWKKWELGNFLPMSDKRDGWQGNRCGGRCHLVGTNQLVSSFEGIICGGKGIGEGTAFWVALGDDTSECANHVCVPQLIEFRQRKLAPPFPFPSWLAHPFPNRWPLFLMRTPHR